jgi:hypothetical protein
MNTGVNVLQWLGVRWWAPEDGAIFVLDCLGKLITGLRIGAVSSLSLFLDNPNLKNAVTVEYTSNIGTGYRLRKVGIFNFNNTKINKIWEHDLSGDDFLSEDAIEARYSLEVSPDGNRIEVKGKITTIPHPWDWKARLAARVKTTFQVYCWDKTGTYKQCN